jgi:hypothetical protein
MSSEIENIQAEGDLGIENIQSEYIRFLLLNGTDPISVLHFTEGIGITEDDFYTHFNSFKAIEKTIWGGFITETIQVLHNDSEYESYSAREKTLAFFYTFIEVLKNNRSFVLFRLGDWSTEKGFPLFLNDFFKEFGEYMNIVISEAIDKQEILSRPVVSNQYVQFYKMSISYILKVWIGDSSSEHQVTDAAIEKSVNLIYDLLQKGPLDGMIDFVKFIYQNKAY